VNPAHLSLAGGSVLLAVQSAYAAALMLYVWEDEEKHTRSRAPRTFDSPRHSFTILLPARHEEAVIQDTIQRVIDLDYPRELVQVLVIVESGDIGTIAKVQEKLAQIGPNPPTPFPRREGGAELSDRAVLPLPDAGRGSGGGVRLLTFDDPPINKPHGLNVGLRRATGDIVTIFDAEDEPHPDILQVVNTVMAREDAPVVQAGVQLMNYGDRWFSALNVLEYFFWFKSRMHYHAAVGMVPLGGNTVFVRRDLLERLGGWDQHCLTEDADLGIRLSAAGIPVRVLYDDEYVTREETPPTVDQFIRQRTRWDQGFLQVLLKGDWLRLPGRPQRLLALYTLAFPLLQAMMMLYLPLSLWMMFRAKVPVLVALLSSLPFYMVGLQFAISLIGLYEFTAVHRLKPSRLSPLRMLVTYLPYQWMLSYAALRAVWRQLRGVNTWEKTTHLGAHRSGVPGAGYGVRGAEYRVLGADGTEAGRTPELVEDVAGG
jgi:cellulose synthase/poly-beta-1,6-N-acetylglucosamine synthase-like glycosyltransferase